MTFSFELLYEAVVFGILLGGFYAAVSIGLSVAFGLLDVPYVAHPAIMVLGAYCTYVLGNYGWDPILAGLALMPPFFLLGIAIYRFYYETFEKRGTDTAVRGLAFFFGVAFIVEIGLVLTFGVDQRLVDASYIGQSLKLGEMRLPLRMLVAFGIALALTGGLTLYLKKTFTGRAIKAVAQDEAALRLMGADPVRIKQWAFGIATAVTALAGAVLILGISESIVLTNFGASWAPAVAFGLLLVVLGIRPQGLVGRWGAAFPASGWARGRRSRWPRSCRSA